MWYDILNFINVVGVVANACLIAFTSRWGERLSFSDKLVFVLIFEVRDLLLHLICDKKHYYRDIVVERRVCPQVPDCNPYPRCS